MNKTCFVSRAGFKSQHGLVIEGRFVQLFFRPDDWTPMMILSNRIFQVSICIFSCHAGFQGMYTRTSCIMIIFSDFKKAAMQNVFFIKSRRTLIMLKHVQVGKFEKCLEILEGGGFLMGCALENFKYASEN